MKKLLFVAFILADIAIALIAFHFFTRHSPDTPLPKTRIADREKILRTANAKLPMMVDAETRLDKIDLNDDGFVYYYRLPEQDGAALPPDWQRELTRRVQKGLCNSPETRSLLDGNLNYTYHYADKGGAEIFTLTVRKGDCD